VPKKTRQRTTQLKLAGIATFQPDAPLASDKPAKKTARTEAVPSPGKPAKISSAREQDALALEADESKSVSANQSKSA
jgi:hypothetical protein